MRLSSHCGNLDKAGKDRLVAIGALVLKVFCLIPGLIDCFLKEFKLLKGHNTQHSGHTGQNLSS